MEESGSGRWEREAEKATDDSAAGSDDPRNQVGTGHDETGDAAFATQEGTAAAAGPGPASADSPRDSNLAGDEDPGDEA